MRYYENIHKTSENRLPQRSYYSPENPGAYTLLNGIWRFRYYPADFMLEEAITQWDEIPVPSCWQLQGYEEPNYTNVRYPYPVDLPYVPDESRQGYPYDSGDTGWPCNMSDWKDEFASRMARAVERDKNHAMGNCPGQNYCDMHHYASYGLWGSTADKEYVEYIMPQEHGNHIGVRYLAFEKGLQFTADTPFECNVSKYSVMDLHKANHINELHADGFTHVRIDYKNSGIGSASCGDPLMEKYKLYGKDMHFAFRITP